MHLLFTSFGGLYKTLFWCQTGFTLGTTVRCSPNFMPAAHVGLDSRNSVAHEQSNRGVKLLCRTLRNSGLELYTSLLAYHSMIFNIMEKSKNT